MELNDFIAEYPELYSALVNDVRSVISERRMTGNETLSEWNNMVDDIVATFEQNNYFGYGMDATPVNNQYNMDAIPVDQFNNQYAMPVDQFNADAIPVQQFGSFRNMNDRDRDRDHHRRHRFGRFNFRDIGRLIFLRELFG